MGEVTHLSLRAAGLYFKLCEMRSTSLLLILHITLSVYDVFTNTEWRRINRTFVAQILYFYTTEHVGGLSMMTYV